MGRPSGKPVCEGVASAGMLCSATELGLSDKADGLLELDADAQPGRPVSEHLLLADQIITLELTPNRGDCSSVRGLAREVAALYQCPTGRTTLGSSAAGARHRGCRCNIPPRRCVRSTRGA